MSEYSFYHEATGEIHSKRIATSDERGEAEFVALNTPADHVPIKGRFDARKHRFDLEKQTIVEVTP